MTPRNRAYELEEEMRDPCDVRRYGVRLAGVDPSETREEAMETPIAWDGWVHELALEPKIGRDRLRPLHDGDGVCYPPPVEDFPDDSVQHFQERIDETRYAAVRARYLEFLWQRTGDFEYSDRALAAYQQAFREGTEADASAASLARIAEWACGLSVSLCHNLEAMRQSVQELLDHLSASPGGHFLKALEAAIPIIAGDATLTYAWLDRLEELVREGLRTTLLDRGAMEVGVRLAEEAGRPDDAERFRNMIPESLEREADRKADAGEGVQGPLLQAALVQYRDLGRSDDVERVKAKLGEAGRQTRESLQEISAEVPVDRDALEAEVESLLREGRKVSPWAHLQLFGMWRSLWPAWEDVERRTEQRDEEHPLLAMMPMVLVAPDGRQRFSPEDPDEERLFRQIRTYVWDAQIVLRFAYMRVQLLQQRDAWSADLILDALASSPLFPEPDRAAIRPGVQAFEDGRYWDAAHVLFPRVEAAVRNLARSLGEETYSLERETGELEWKSLDRLLKLDAVEDVLNSMRPSFCREIRFLLLDSRGLNLRHELAHGTRTPNQVSRLAPLLFLMILLSLSVVSGKDEDGSRKAAPPPSD